MKRKSLLRFRVILPVILLVVVLLIPPAANAAGRYHIVRRGETLTGIAWRYGTTVNAIVKANGIWNRNRIYVGQRLWIPGWSGGGKAVCKWGCTHVVRKGQTLSQIALRYGTTVRALVNQNGLKNANRIYVGQRLCVPCGWGWWGRPACRKVHVVVRGQTLSSIARWYGTTVWALARANGIANINRIWVGQRLCIPRWWDCP